MINAVKIHSVWSADWHVYSYWSEHCIKLYSVQLVTSGQKLKSQLPLIIIQQASIAAEQIKTTIFTA